MKRHSLAKLLLVTFAVFTLISISAAQTAPASKPNEPAISLQGAVLVAELAKSVDARKAAAGDRVKAKIMQDVISNGQIVIRRGSKLVGHITEARVFNQQGPRSILGLVFDRIAIKGGEEVSFNSALLALAPPAEQPDVLSGSSSVYGGGTANGSQPVSRGAARSRVTARSEGNNHLRQDALNNAANPNSYGHTSNNVLHNGFLDAGNRGVFGMPGLALKARPGVPGPELVSNLEDITLKEGTQIVFGITGMH